MQPKHSAIVAGLTLALSFGAVTAPAPAAAEEPTPGVASNATDIDKGLYTQQSFSGVLRSVQGVSFVNVTPEMKYFTKYESHGNYNQGLFVWRRLQRAGLLPVRPSLVAHPVYEAGLQLQPRKIRYAQGSD